MELRSFVVGAAAGVSAAVGAFAVGAAATDNPPSISFPALPTTVPTESVPGSDTPGATTTVLTVAPTISAAPAPAAATVDISNFSFSPAELTVAVGTTVTWTNSDGTDHSIVSLDGSIISPTIAQGQTFSFTFTTAGTFQYICGFHQAMTGTITVTG